MLRVAFGSSGTYMRANGDYIRKVLETQGLVRFSADSSEDLHRTVKSIGRIVHHRDANDDGFTVVEYNEKMNGVPGYRGMGHEWLAAHTDSSGVNSPPRGMALACEESAGSGGESLLVDGYRVYEALNSRYPEAARALSEPDSIIFRSGDEMHCGSVFSYDGSGRLLVRFRSDEHGYFSGEVLQWLGIVHKIIASHSTSISLSPGEGYIVDNHRFLHGRNSFDGTRKMLRVLFDF